MLCFASRFLVKHIFTSSVILSHPLFISVPCSPRTLISFLTSLAKQSDKDSRADIRKVFNLFDDDKTGHITLKNLKRVARELGETMSEAELLEMIERADTDEDGEISPDEFYVIMTKKTFVGHT